MQSMFDAFICADAADATAYDYELAVSAVRGLPDRSAADVNELATRIGAQKLTVIKWLRTDLKFARLVESKVCK
jgi:hypothetical protein